MNLSEKFDERYNIFILHILSEKIKELIKVLI
jgi:hypothetical protein